MKTKYSKENLKSFLTMSQDEYEQKKADINEAKKNNESFVQKSFYITKRLDSAIMIKIAHTKDRKIDRSSIVREALNSYLKDVLDKMDEAD